MSKAIGSRSWLLAMAGAVFVLFGVATSRAEACSCLTPTVESSYNNSDSVIIARPALEVNWGNETWYLARVRQNYKGCESERSWVILTTSDSGASCGLDLAVGIDYLINGNLDGSFFGIAKLAFGLCDYNVTTDALTPQDREFLSGRNVCCGSDCQCADGSEPVNCFVDPCDVAAACPEGECVANYCGGCNAEFYDEQGLAVCLAPEPCATDSACGEGQYCASDMSCESDGMCDSDVDCNLEGNAYAHIECVGQGVCDEASSSCGWECGVPVCTPGEVTEADECGNVCGCTEDGLWICTLIACDSGCDSDADCMITGCSSQVCSNQPVETTCQFRPEFACYQDPSITTCGCQAGQCGWEPTPALSECIASQGAGL